MTDSTTMPAIPNTTSINPIGAATALPRLTVGIDLGDRHSDLCAIDQSGEVLEESRLPAAIADRSRAQSGRF